ncbi:hypothetical protein [Streptomyces jumonjinensis]|uniref:M1 family metallopeptidase n=1 Tax=Streptomyces jumonjinensis TaxID=1945 RepID=A0A646KFH0_STRJU|nr:hypothetical protein [Streptomyces jumonjinensis]MQT01005.1 hypothetical protein [Streptomyces jumonjinensis]
MADHRRAGHAAARAATGLVLAVVLLAPALLSGCAPPRVADPAADEVRRVLDARAAAVLARDERAYLAGIEPGSAELYSTERRRFRDMADVPFGSWEYRLGAVDRDGDRAVAGAELRYRLSGYDSAPVTAEREISLERHDGRWYVADDRPAEGAAELLWQQGEVEAVRGERSLVLAVGQDPARVRALARAADRSVPAVTDAWPSPWAGRVVVLVPETLEAMGELLGAPAAGYGGIAAVTTGETGVSGPGPADRVIVNPAAYGALGDFGKEVVLTHETTHVATRAYTSPATPMWLSEGFADWAAYRDTGRTASQTAPELQRAVRAGDAPARLPDDEDFAFGGDADRLARAYEGGWLACELIAERWGERRLTDFYRAVGRGSEQTGAVEHAFAEVLETTPADFTAEWRAYLHERLGTAAEPGGD